MAIVAGAVVSACNSGSPAGQSSGPVPDSAPVKLRVAVAFAPKAGWALETNDAFVLTNVGVLETLVRTDFDGRAEPGLATSWEQADERSWRFRLRAGVSFQNQEPFNAAAVAGALNRVVNSATPPRGLASAIAEVVDDTTVLVRAARPDPVLPLRLSSPSTGILAPAAYGVDRPSRPFGTGTGPFELVSERPGELIVLKANAGYWGGKPALEEVEVRFLPDPATRAASLRAGELDLAQGIPASQVPVLKGLKGITLISAREPRTTTLYTNTKTAKLGDRRVREALALAIDRRLIADGVLDGAASPAAGVFRPESEWSRDRLRPPAPDPARAVSLLAEAGYGKGELELSLWTYTDRPGLNEVATAVQAMLAQVGVAARIQVSPYASLEPDVLAAKHDLFLLSRSYLTDTNDPGGFLASDYTCHGAYNLNHFCHEELDAAADQLATTSDPQRRFDVFRRAEDLILSEFAGVPLVHDQVTTALRASVEGYRADPLGRQLLTPTLTVRP